MSYGKYIQDQAGRVQRYNPRGGLFTRAVDRSTDLAARSLDVFKQREADRKRREKELADARKVQQRQTAGLFQNIHDYTQAAARRVASRVRQAQPQRKPAGNMFRNIVKQTRSRGRDFVIGARERAAAKTRVRDYYSKPKNRAELASDLDEWWDEDEFQRDPLKYVLQSPTFREKFTGHPEVKTAEDWAENLSTIRRENKGYGPGWRTDYATPRVNDVVLEDVLRYASSEEGFPNVVSGNIQPGASIGGIVADETGSKFLGGLTDSALLYVPVLGAANIGARSGETSGRAFAGDLIETLGGTLVFGRPLNIIESQVASRVGARAAGSGASRFLGSRGANLAGRSAARGGMNVAEDVPLTAAEMAVRGFSPGEIARGLPTQAAYSGLFGTAAPVAGASLGRARRAPGVGAGLEAGVTGGGLYAGASFFGADQERARAIGMAGAAGTQFKRGRIGDRAVDAAARRVNITNPLRNLGGSVTFETGRIAGSNRRVIPDSMSRGQQEGVPDGARIPQPMARERLLFHSTEDLTFELPDPQKSLGQATASSQGAGVYMAADPKKSVPFGPRTFISEFDGKSVNFHEPYDAAFWKPVVDDLDRKFYELGRPRGRLQAAFDKTVETAMVIFGGFRNNFEARDGLFAAAERTAGVQPRFTYPAGQGRYLKGQPAIDDKALSSPVLLGQFSDFKIGEHNRREGLLTAINDSMSKTTDGFFYNSSMQGDVFVILNGDRTRVVKRGDDAAQFLAELEPETRLRDITTPAPLGPSSPSNVEWRYADKPEFDPDVRVIQGRVTDVNDPRAEALEVDAIQRFEGDPNSWSFAIVTGSGSIVHSGDGLSMRGMQQSAENYFASQEAANFFTSRRQPRGTIKDYGYVPVGGAGHNEPVIGASGGTPPPPRPPAKPSGDAFESQDGIHRATKLGDFKMGQTVHNPANGKELGKVVGINGNGDYGRVTVEASDGTRKTYLSSSLLSSSDYSKNINAYKLKESLEHVTPSDGAVNAVARKLAEYSLHSEAQTAARRPKGKLASVVGIFDPGARNAEGLSQQIHQTVLAARNFAESQKADAIRYVSGAMAVLSPLTKEVNPVRRHLYRAGAQAGTAVAGVGAGMGAAELTGIDELRDAGVVAGGVGMGIMSGLQRRGFMHDNAFKHVNLLIEDRHMPAELRSGEGKLIDIIERPSAYDLSDAQKAAISDYFDMRRKRLKETNAYRAAMGLTLIPELSGSDVFHWYTKKSVEEALPGDKSAIEIHTPARLRNVPVERKNKLGETYYDALRDNRKLKIAGSLREMLSEESRHHAEVRANALFVGELKAMGSHKIEDQRFMTDDERTAAKKKIEELRDGGWKELPGIDDHLFNPEVHGALKNQLGTEQGLNALNFLDQSTHLVRQLMFVGDASAWTMQGAMAAIDNPWGAMRNCHHLVGASVFGEKYFNWWLSRNEDLWNDYTRAGGTPGRQFEGLETEGWGGQLAGRVPGLRALESRGFEYFLPMHRALIWRNTTQIEGFLDQFGGRGAGIGARRATIAAAELAPVAGVVGLSATGNLPDVTNEKADTLMATALAGFFGAHTVNRAVTSIGGRRLNKLKATDPGQLKKIEARTAKHVARTSGVINRQQLGMSNRQSAIERMFLMRSPGLTRNMFNLARLAVSNVGPEGAMARVFLVKTAMLYGTALAAYKYMETGEWDSFDWKDPESIFSPGGFMRANMGPLGKVAPSNPMISLMRAVLYQDRPAGEDTLSWSRENWKPEIGFKQVITGRMPDVSGIVGKEGVDLILSGGFNEGDKPGILNSLFSGDSNRVAKTISSRTMPLSVQQTVDTGLLNKTATGERLGLTGDPNFNDPGEKARSIIGAFAGLNYNPETLGQEKRRIDDEDAQNYNPGLTDRDGSGRIGRGDLNSEQRKEAKARLEGNEKYQAILVALEEEYGDVASPIGNFLDEGERINEVFAEELALAEARYQALGNAELFKEEHKAATQRHRQAQDNNRNGLGAVDAEMRGHDDVTVVDFLARNAKPEDLAVDEWYALYDAARQLDGTLDWDKLEADQDAFIRGLDRKTRAYVERQTAYESKGSPGSGLWEWEQAKKVAQPYWDARDEAFTRAVKSGGILGEFQSWSQLEDYVSQVVAHSNMNDGTRISTDEAMRILSQRDRGLRRYLREIDRLDRRMLRHDSKLDGVLVKWFGRAPKSRDGMRARRQGQRLFTQEVRSGGLFQEAPSRRYQRKTPGRGSPALFAS